MTFYTPQDYPDLRLNKFYDVAIKRSQTKLQSLQNQPLNIIAPFHITTVC